MNVINNNNFSIAFVQMANGLGFTSLKGLYHFLSGCKPNIKIDSIRVKRALKEIEIYEERLLMIDWNEGEKIINHIGTKVKVLYNVDNKIFLGKIIDPGGLCLSKVGEVVLFNKEFFKEKFV